MKRSCLQFLVVFLLGISSSLQQCVIESVQGAPQYVCNSIQELEDEGNSNLFDASIYSNGPNVNKSATPNLKIVLLEDSAEGGYSPNTFRLLKELANIFKHDQVIDTLPAALFRNLSVQDLNLQNKGIANIETGTFSTLRSLRNLHIVENKLTRIKAGIFNNLPLEKLALSKNKINTIEKDAFRDTYQMKFLFLDGNLLTEFQPEVTMNHADKLEELRLQHNSFSEVDRYTLKGLTNLKKLDMSENKISHCASYTFDNLPKLEILNLGNNLLLELKAESFPAGGLQNLIKLYIHSNRLSFLTTTMLERVKSMTHFRMGGNPWQCPCFEAILTWLNDHDVQLPCDKDYFSGTRPVCVIDDVHPMRCAYDNDHAYYQKYAAIHNRSPQLPDCELI